ncbi:MAG: hypothetical protein AAF515_14730 [Pseudomonadota bacterium]
MADETNDSAELSQARDDARCQAAVQTMKDALWRFDETSEGSYSVYDLVSYLIEDLVTEGCCAACLNEAVAAAFEQTGANPAEHQPDDQAVLH